MKHIEVSDFTVLIPSIFGCWLLTLNAVTSKKPSFTLLFIEDFPTTHSNAKTLPYFTPFIELSGYKITVSVTFIFFLSYWDIISMKVWAFYVLYTGTSISSINNC